VEVTNRPRQWLLREDNNYDDTLMLMDRRFIETVNEALADAGAKLSDIAWFVHATVIKPIAEWGFLRKLGLDVRRTSYEAGLDLGHMGNSDQFVGIDHLITTRAPRPGDVLATVGIGIGFMWTAAVFEFIEIPQW
jgi:3-oxoacyl-[acyl-carrier-protein] synthase-3